MNTQPLYAASVLVRTHTARRRVVSKDLVIAATDKGRVAAVDAATGKRVWERRLGWMHVNCGDLPYYGITGTPTIDRATNSVYVGNANGRVYRLDLSSGRVKHRWTITYHPANGYDISALTFDRGIVYVELAGYCDHPPYRGELVAINTRNGHINRWFPTPTNGGGIWGFGGISIDPAVGVLYAATGNLIGTTDHEGYSERVVRLTRGLRVTASNYPGLPATGDADFGATPMLYRAPGCPAQLAVGNKSGAFFVYDRAHIGNGPVQRITLGGSSNGRDALIGVDAYLPSERTVYVSNPNPSGGTRRDPRVPGDEQLPPCSALAGSWSRQDDIEPNGRWRRGVLRHRRRRHDRGARRANWKAPVGSLGRAHDFWSPYRCQRGRVRERLGRPAPRFRTEVAARTA